MRNQIISNVASDSSSQSTHRAIQTRFDSSKTYAHRYERRKIREVLRLGGNAAQAFAAEAIQRTPPEPNASL